MSKEFPLAAASGVSLGSFKVSESLADRDLAYRYFSMNKNAKGVMTFHVKLKFFTSRLTIAGAKKLLSSLKKRFIAYTQILNTYVFEENDSIITMFIDDGKRNTEVLIIQLKNKEEATRVFNLIQEKRPQPASYSLSTKLGSVPGVGSPLQQVNHPIALPSEQEIRQHYTEAVPVASTNAVVTEPSTTTYYVDMARRGQDQPLRSSPPREMRSYEKLVTSQPQELRWKEDVKYIDYDPKKGSVVTHDGPIYMYSASQVSVNPRGSRSSSRASSQSSREDARGEYEAKMIFEDDDRKRPIIYSGYVVTDGTNTQTF